MNRKDLQARSRMMDDPSILLSSGKYFSFVQPYSSTIHIEDIAAGLSKTCCLGGQTDRFYSEAQHAVLLSEMLPRQHQLPALLHRAAKAFMGTVTPHALRWLEGYKRLLNMITRAVFTNFDLVYPFSKEIVGAHYVLEATAISNFMKNTDPFDVVPEGPISEKIEPWSCKKAETEFLRRYFELVGTQDRKLNSPVSDNWFIDHYSPDLPLQSGGFVNYSKLEKSDVQISDIAKGLSNICRYSGQIDSFYSVAQHSTLAAWGGSTHNKLSLLLHDAQEALLFDVATPLKHFLPELKPIESTLNRFILDKFNVLIRDTSSIKNMDLVLLATEVRDLIPNHDRCKQLSSEYTPFDKTIEPQSPWQAYDEFLYMYNMLTENSEQQKLVHA